MKTTDRMLEKIHVILEGYKSGEHINLNKLSAKISRLDKRIQMDNIRLSALLKMHKDELVVYTKDRWFKK